MDLNLTMGIGLSQKRPVSDLYQDPNLGQAAGSEVGGRAASYEFWGPNKRNVYEGGSTVDRPQGIIPIQITLKVLSLTDMLMKSTIVNGHVGPGLTNGTTHLVRVPVGFHILILT